LSHHPRQKNVRSFAMRNFQDFFENGHRKAWQISTTFKQCRSRCWGVQSWPAVHGHRSPGALSC
jgi:hypothetical protein